MTIFRIQYFFERLCTWIYTEFASSCFLPSPSSSSCCAAYSGRFLSLSLARSQPVFPGAPNEIVKLWVQNNTWIYSHAYVYTHPQGHGHNKYADKCFTTKRIVRIQMPLSFRVERAPNQSPYTQILSWPFRGLVGRLFIRLLAYSLARLPLR